MIALYALGAIAAILSLLFGGWCWWCSVVFAPANRPEDMDA